MRVSTRTIVPRAEAATQMLGKVRLTRVSRTWSSTSVWVLRNRPCSKSTVSV